MRPLARAQQPYTGITTVLGAPAELPQAPASVAHIAADKRGPQPRCTQCCETVLSARECAPHSRVPRAAICCWVKSNPEYPVPIRLSPGFMHRKLERVAFDQIRTFTLHPEAAIALANAFGVQGEFE